MEKKKDLLRLTDLSAAELYEIFHIADRICEGDCQGFLNGKSAVLFFPASSIRTRVTFEKGIWLLGGQPVLFPADALDKKEAVKDVCGYLNNWADIVIVRHKDIRLIGEMAGCLKVPVINAMADACHPCEILSDLYTLSKIRDDFTKDHYLFCGSKGNIGLSWKEAAEVLGLDLAQCCFAGDEMDDIRIYHDIKEAVKGRDIICTDSLPANAGGDPERLRITRAVMDMADENALLNPCPPFYRGEEVSDDAVESDYFVGYEFKKNLLTVQQAVMIWLMDHGGQMEGRHETNHGQEKG